MHTAGRCERTAIDYRALQAEMAHCDEILSFIRRSLDRMPHKWTRTWRVEP